jgi:hypothetical protein
MTLYAHYHKLVKDNRRDIIKAINNAKSVAKEHKSRAYGERYNVYLHHDGTIDVMLMQANESMYAASRGRAILLASWSTGPDYYRETAANMLDYYLDAASDSLDGMDEPLDD